MAEPNLVLAVDGGNSKTLAAVATVEGEILACVRGEGSDIYGRRTPDLALDVLERTVRDALDAAGATVSELAALVFSLAGADWPEDFALLERELASRLALRRPVTLVNDALGGLRAGAPRWEGVAVVCGTGNAVGARNLDGRTFHLGFWPDRIGGFDLGRKALDAVYRHGLDLGPPTRLTEHALALFEASDPLDLLHAFTRREGKRSALEAQRLAPLLLKLADEDDAVSGAIVERAGRALGDQARVCAARVGLPLAGTSLVLCGGVLRQPAHRLVDAILERVPGARVIRTSAEPLVGALLIAYDELGRTPSRERLCERIANAAAESPARAIVER